MALVAGCMLAAFGAAHAQVQNGSGQQGDKHQEKAQPHQAQPAPPQLQVRKPVAEPKLADSGPVSSEFTEPDCDRPKKQSEAELCVQRRSADIAESALHWNKIQTIGAIFGVLLVFATLIVTAQTGKAASVAAMAAVDAVNSERAWMTFDGVTVETRSNYRDEDGLEYTEAIGLSVRWSNTGRNPALKAGAAGRNNFITPYDNVVDHPNVIVTDSERRSEVGPGQHISSPTLWIYGVMLDQFKEKTLFALMYSTVKYSTIGRETLDRHSDVITEFHFDGQTTADDGRTIPCFRTKVLGSRQNAS